MRALSAWLAALAALVAAAPAHAGKDITPYIEIQQVLDADLDDGGDVLTYSTLAAGIDAVVTERRTQVQISYRYEHRFAWDDDSSDEDVHSGLARAAVQLVPDVLTLEGGALATRSRVDIRGAAPNPSLSGGDNITQVYSFYAGPTLSTMVGDLGVSAAYRFGYTKVEADSDLASLPPSQVPLDLYDDATNHLASVSLSQRPGELPFGWSLGAGWEREDASQLDQRFDGRFVRGDVTVPVSPTVALVGGVGYEDIEVSQRDALRDTNGAPVRDNDGRFVTDPASERKIAYDIDGLIYDAGVVWKPSRRTQLEARVGRRYGGTTVIGSFSHQLSRNAGVQVVVYDGVESFGRLLSDNVARLPTSFNVPGNPLGGGFNGCVFGESEGTGGCLNDVFQSISTANFRSRGINAMYAATMGRTSYGLGLGYAQRKYYAPRFATGFSVDGLKDDSVFVQGYWAYELSERSSVNASAYLSQYDSGLPFAPDVTSAGATLAYLHNFTRRLTGTAALGLYSFDQQGFASDLTASALAAMRYQF